MKLSYNGQSGQDKFVCSILNYKRGGYFVEVGSWLPQYWNNTFVLEHSLGWEGMMFEYHHAEYQCQYKEYRPNSLHFFGDAQKYDFASLLKRHNAPGKIDYLQLDIDPPQQTLNILRHLDDKVMDDYQFAVVTYEHDYYCGGVGCRLESREIFERRGYKLIFPDVNDGDSRRVYEDWYVHPDLVDMGYVNRTVNLNLHHYQWSEYGDVDATIDSRKISYPLRS